MSKAVVLLSGGLDSTVLLASIVDKYGAKNVTALSIFYGQKHHKEVEYARYQSEKYGVELLFMDLSSCYSFDTTCTLLSGNAEIPTGSYAEQINEQGIINTYVPFRNGLFLSFAAGLALQIGADHVYYGAHSDDVAVSAYPDCSHEFIVSMQQAIKEGTGSKVTLIAPFWDYTKARIVSLGMHLEVDFANTWSCYEGKDTPCGVCGTCVDRIKAFESIGFADPHTLVRKENSEEAGI